MRVLEIKSLNSKILFDSKFVKMQFAVVDLKELSHLLLNYVLTSKKQTQTIYFVKIGKNKITNLFC